MNGSQRSGATGAVFTPRLVLTPAGPGDIEDLRVLHGDPEVDFWSGPWTDTTTAVWAEEMARRWAADGVGKWLARDRTDATLVGRGGLSRIELDGETVLELGWAVRDSLTGRGFATEIGRAGLEWAAKHQPGLPVVAFTEVHNHGSQAVMRRLGLRPAGVIYRDGLVAGRSGVQPDAPFALYRLVDSGGPSPP